METEVFELLNKIIPKMLGVIERMDTMEDNFKKMSDKAYAPLGERWLDIQDACMALKISKRTLQNYREKHPIPTSIIIGKVYFKATDINRLLQKNYLGIKGF